MGGFEEVKGKAKETVGGLTGSDSLREEGQSQQRKAEQEEKADQARAEAERHEERAEAFESNEERHQGT
ncbi:MAG TPA: CsbD family protein [Pseudonocardia sp.]|uniref:CsbD family protein n=1 Tax=Pseudonocardia sp. TaxID=60912 RepID=UPI002CCDEFE4|nr:CsbD family protein [Pseudonocardia sp.]HTF50201.1 CsbD family protein [Pseudonocardia sp.]